MERVRQLLHRDSARGSNKGVKAFQNGKNRGKWLLAENAVWQSLSRPFSHDLRYAMRMRSSLHNACPTGTGPPAGSAEDNRQPFGYNGVQRFGIAKLGFFFSDPFHSLLNLPWYEQTSVAPTCAHVYSASYFSYTIHICVMCIMLVASITHLSISELRDGASCLQVEVHHCLFQRLRHILPGVRPDLLGFHGDIV